MLSFTQNKVLSKYDLKFNTISEEGIQKFIEDLIPGAPHVSEVEVSNILSEEVRAEFTAALANNKPKKGGKGKKKKK